MIRISKVTRFLGYGRGGMARGQEKEGLCYLPSFPQHEGILGFRIGEYVYLVLLAMQGSECDGEIYTRTGHLKLGISSGLDGTVALSQSQ
jgi:hypothetical protein